MCGIKHLKYPSSMEELREPISLPSSFQMELLFKTKTKRHHQAIRKVNHFIFQLLVHLMDCLDRNTGIAQ